MNKKVNAKTTEQGYIQVAIAESPGCLARAETLLKRAALFGLAFGLGFLAGAWLM